MQIDLSARQCANIFSSKRERREPFSKVAICRLLQKSKHFAEMHSTDAGMTMAVSAEQHEKAENPIRDSSDPDSNVTLDSLVQSVKHFSQSVPTCRGMQIDLSDVQVRNAFASIHKS
jgi:hypothetical protein